MTRFTQWTLISAATVVTLVSSACTQDSRQLTGTSETRAISHPASTTDDTRALTASDVLSGSAAHPVKRPGPHAVMQEIGQLEMIDVDTMNDASHNISAGIAAPSATTISGLARIGKRTLHDQNMPRHDPQFAPPYSSPHGAHGEQYAELLDNASVQTSSQPVSTFSIDVDTGAYSNVRRFLQHGQLPPPDAVRIEEMLNYFSYDYPMTASAKQPFSVVTELGAAPWNDKRKLLHIGLKGYLPDVEITRKANLVFLIDVSGSMNSPDKLGLLKSSISLLAHELDASDTVSMVVYAGSSGIVLEPTAGDQHRVIDRALSQLSAGGSTNGAGGIELAYQLAAEHFDKDGINRVILATDGDFNVGISDTEQLKKLISRKRDSGISLTTLGFGTGNYNDHLMEQLADVGNGTYAYIDTLGEARKVLVDELQSTLLTIARDVKIQVEFNPAVVSEYRLIGYTNRKLANEDFNNDKVDAGDIGAGHTVTALYEVALKGQGGDHHTPRRYGQDPVATETQLDGELAEIRLRYKLPENTHSQLISQIVQAGEAQQASAARSENFRFSASVAAFGQLLRDNKYMDSFGYEETRNLALQARGEDPFGYRAEFIRLLDTAMGLDRIQRAANGVPDGQLMIDEG